MPLKHLRTKAAFRKNVAELVKSGKKKNVALAIAYKIKGEKKKK